jgi:hypothetical protein
MQQGRAFAPDYKEHTPTMDQQLWNNQFLSRVTLESAIFAA